MGSVFKAGCRCKRSFLFSPLAIEESLKAVLPLMTMVNELWGNHCSPSKHWRKPNGTLSHNTLIRAHLESALQPLHCSFVLVISVHVK